VTDPFDTASIRERVLAAWAASPARFREDANAEEDAAAGLLLPELAQNAADAAARAEVTGRLHVEVSDGVLYAANTGAPLDAAGVAALCHLRASAKSAGVGRYGVGFKAVLAVTDAPAIVSRTGGVRWSRAETLAAVSAVPALAAEVARRDGAVPVMRLPFPAAPDARAATLLADYDTVVVLPLSGPVDLDADETLLLTLDLDALTVGGTTLRRDPSWVVHRAAGEVPAVLLADRPVEERERPGWAVTVAVPTREGIPVPWEGDRLLRAPQRTAERVDLPVFLSVSVPLEPSRRHVVPGPLADWLAARAAETYVALLESLPPSPATLDLLPSTLPAGPVDLALREALAPLLARAAVFPGGRRGDEVSVADLGPASDAVTALLDGLLDPAWLGGGRRRAALSALGVRVLDTADVVDLLAGADREPSWWAAMYAALAGVPDRDALRALPVPLADGRVVTGPPGLLLPTDADLVAASEPLGLRWVHPGVATGRAAEVLRGAGAVVPEPGALLDSLRDAVEASLDDEPPVEPDALADVVLRLLAAEPGAATGRDWLGSLALPSADGDLRPAEELLLPESYGGRLVRWVRADSPFGVVASFVVEAHGADAVVAAGVVATLTEDTEFGGVRDLEWVRDDAWSEALDALPVLDDETLEWLRRNVLLPAADGALHRIRDLAAPDADPLLASLYVTTTATSPVVARLGLVTTVDALDDDGLAGLADRIADGAGLDQTRALYAALARAGVPLDPPNVRAVINGALVTVATQDAFAVDRPDLLPLLGDRPWLPVDVALGPALADVLGVRLASSLEARVTSSAASTARLPDLAPGAPDLGVEVHDPLLVNDVRVAWFAGRPLAVDGSTAGVARLVAWLRGDWPSRYAVEATLRGDPLEETLLDPG
jgi:hypothetical protein